MTTDIAAQLQAILSGDVAEGDVEQFLLNLSARGETADDLTQAARVLRTMMVPIDAPADTVDCCGTGGDGRHTFNVSTAVALVAAACGVPMAKHGNRAASSKSGAADVLSALGVNLNLTPAHLSDALCRFNFCFLMAPNHHPSLKHVAAARKKIGRRTIFNLLGPLLNPAGAKRQLVGVFDDVWRRPMAQALKNLGTETAWVVHGDGGYDEITTTGDTRVTILRGGDMMETTISPEQVGLPRARPDDLTGGDAADNAAALTDLLAGKKSAYRDIVLMNAMAVLNIHGHCPDLKLGVERAAHAIDSGAAHATLQSYIDFSQGNA
jgi:anthranilate phosphoribosyltransferase